MADIDTASRPFPHERLRFRTELRAGDVTIVRELVRASGFFKPIEVDVAAELVEERMDKGPASGYEFLFAEADARAVGYACFGPVPATEGSFDLYWIAVELELRGRGIGMRLLACCEAAVVRAGGRRLYADTSAREQYAATRAFYRRAGFRRAAFLEDFYAPDDGKLIYCKSLTGGIGAGDESSKVRAADS